MHGKFIPLDGDKYNKNIVVELFWKKKGEWSEDMLVLPYHTLGILFMLKKVTWLFYWLSSEVENNIGPFMK